MFFHIDHNLMFMIVWSILDTDERGNKAANAKRQNEKWSFKM